MKGMFSHRFKARTRTEWEQVFDGKDACCTPVLSQTEPQQQGYEQRPAVGLTSSPGLDIPQHEAWSSQGLSPGAGGDEVLESWMGGRRDRNYKVEEGALVIVEAAKL